MSSKTQKFVASLNIIDDVLFQKMAEDVGFCEEMLSIILKSLLKYLNENVILKNRREEM